jgi:hypothetical protein
VNKESSLGVAVALDAIFDEDEGSASHKLPAGRAVKKVTFAIDLEGNTVLTKK